MPTAICDTPGTARAIAVSGDYAYVADEEGGLQIIGIANPLLPSIVEVCFQPSVEVSGGETITPYLPW